MGGNVTMMSPEWLLLLVLVKFDHLIKEICEATTFPSFFLSSDLYFF